jgi:hypothetical protein
MAAHPPFIVLALPRSRTFWLSEFLSYRDWHCGHDELIHMRTLDDCRTWFTQPCIGTVETAAAPFWRLLPSGLRVVTVRRPVVAVLASVLRAVPGCDPTGMEKLLRAADAKLDQIEARVPGVLSVRFDDLATEETCGEIFEHCLPYPHDPRWWAAMDARHVSGKLSAQIRYCRAYIQQLQILGRAARQEMLARLHRSRARRPPMDGFVFGEERFAPWLADAQPLFRDHLAQTGQDADGHALKNLPMGHRLDEVGALQIIGARQNGRLFGYSMAVISPSLDARDQLMAHLLLPFASRDFPGLGRRIHAAAIEALRSKGVSQIVGRAGVRGDGPRLGAMYRRLGFADDGQLFRLEVEQT